MVKHVVKPLKMGFLREKIVPKKSVFTRRFSQCLQGLFGFCSLARSALLPAGASPPVSCSQTKRATNCATSRLFIWNGYIIANFCGKVKSFIQFLFAFGEKLLLLPFLSYSSSLSITSSASRMRRATTEQSSRVSRSAHLRQS